VVNKSLTKKRRREILLIALLLLVVFLVMTSVRACTRRKRHAAQKQQTKTEAQSPKQPALSPQTKLKNAAAQTGNTAQLINKTHTLPPSYVPKDLVKVNAASYRTVYLRKEAAQALATMFNAGKKAGVNLYCSSGYRSYADQQKIFSNHMASMGRAKANAISSKAGQSEHQSGFAMDVTCRAMSGDLQERFIQTNEGKWLAAHAHEYGFIVRFPKGKEASTDYSYEPWHIRYLGKDLATKVNASGLSYEEYLAKNAKLAAVIDGQ
jgi:D-alanyl-D-alanine carboxypeptidase